MVRTKTFLVVLASAAMAMWTPAHADGQRSRQKTATQKRAPAPSTPESIAASAPFRLQVALDRAGFSPGEIDGKNGAVTKRALAAFQKERGLPQTGEPDAASLTALGVTPGSETSLVTQHTIAADDVKGPFVEKIPDDMVEKSKLQALGYTGALEALAERFHIAPALLKGLNPSSTFATGEAITVPAITPPPAPPVPVADRAKPADRSARGRAGRANSPAPVGTAGTEPAIVVSVSKSAEALTVKDASGKVLMFAPVTVGSEHDPLPLGTWKVTGVQRNPVFNYNPDLFWDADPSHTKATIAAGPNNPVGTVWIDLDRPHYGIHGTPEPGKIGYRQSHGCVRLTNWDAMKLASMVKRGTTVLFEP